MNKNRFYNFSFENPNEAELYLYGDIVSEKWEENDVTFEDFKNKLDIVPDNGVLRIFQNSGGGDCFVASSMCSLIKRAQDRGVKVIATIDSLSASASSWISCAADELQIYNHSILMLHKPLTFQFGTANADTMKKEIEVLDAIQNGVMLPIYMGKAKEGVTEDMIQELVNNETWMDSKQIQEYFNCTLLEGETKMVASTSKSILNRYKNVPNDLKELLNKKEDELVEENIINEEIVEETCVEEEKPEQVDETTEEVSNEVETSEVEDFEDAKKKRKCEIEDNISDMQEQINSLTKEKEELENKLNESNEKVISLNDKISELQPIVDKYNEEVSKAKEVEDKKLLEDKKTYYKDKFEKLGARAKFESEEVQNLLSNCIKDEKSQSILNLMIVDMITVEEKKTVNKVEQISKIENLIPSVDTIEEKYGFR